MRCPFATYLHKPEEVVPRMLLEAHACAFQPAWRLPPIPSNSPDDSCLETFLTSWPAWTQGPRLDPQEKGQRIG